MRQPPVSDQAAYCTPMVAFLALTWLGGNSPGLYLSSYVAKTVIVGSMLVYFWPKYTAIRWTHLWLGVIAGIIGVFQWVGMQLWLQDHWEVFRPAAGKFQPTEYFTTQWGLVAFLTIRIIGAVVVVPVMEELFWRDFLWRTCSTREPFKTEPVGVWNVQAFAVVCLAFASVHGNWWLTSIIWAGMIGGLLVYTKSLGACIIAHAVTNLLLAGYVMGTRDWSFW